MAHNYQLNGAVSVISTIYGVEILVYLKLEALW